MPRKEDRHDQDRIDRADSQGPRGSPKVAPEEQIRRLVAYGTINEKGEVLMGLNAEDDDEEPTSGDVKRNGD